MRLGTALLASALLALPALPACDPVPSAPREDGAPPPSARETDGAAPAPAPRPVTAFAELVNKLSEPDRRFFSDNTVSNETSYLHVGPGLARHARQGGAYIGVGPETNFSYIATLRPKLAFIVDIRRENLVLHLLYKALFRAARSRSHFLALLVGRPHDAASDPGARASIDEVLEHAEKLPPDEATFAASHADLARSIEEHAHFALDARDAKSLEVSHRAFFKGQLDLRFSLQQKNGRLYPTLRELLSATDLEGRQAGFLATEDAFRFVQALEREDRVVPVVGDFAGDRALPGIAATLRERGLTVSAFYVSNVEQYLFESGVWARWARNVAALPVDERSVFIRAYLDQGKRHPREQRGHRTASVLQRMIDFEARQAKKPYTSWFEVATDPLLD